MASTAEDLTRLAIIGIYNDLENDKPSQYFLVGSLIYLFAYVFLKYEIAVVYWGFFAEAIDNNFGFITALFTWRVDWPELFIHISAYPVFYAHDYTVWMYGEDFNLREEDQIWYFWFLCYPLLYWTTGYLYSFFADFILPFVFIYYLIEPKAFIDYDKM